MNESGYWKTVRPLLAGLDPVRVENPAHPGTPDVNITLGWIELKWAEAPKRSTTPLKLDHFTPQQKVWLFKRARAGGSCWLLLRVGVEWFLFKGNNAAKHIGEATVAELSDLADRWWPSKPSMDEFQRALHETCILQRK